jgi:crotonobetainyl-CoA:carnitine CoA-transferase CaiB-like acyl-CoA transferase
VIRIDPPGGVPRHQQPSYQAWDRGKKSVVLDLEATDGRKVLDGLLSRADVFVADDPAAVAGLKLGPDDLSDRYNQLVYLCLSSDGRLAELRLLDDTLTAARLGTFMQPDGLRHNGWLLPTYSAASVALIGVVGALFAKVRGRGGQRVEVSMRDGLLDVLTFGQWRQDRTSDAPPPDLRLQRLMYNMYECGDGKFLQFHTGAPGRFWRTMQLLGLDDRISPSKGLLEMGELLSEEELRIVQTDVPLIMKSKDRDEWLQLFWDADICCQPVLEPQEAFADPQVIHNEMVVELNDPEVGLILSVGPPVKMWKSPAVIRQPRSRLGEHTEEVVMSCGVLQPITSNDSMPDAKMSPPLEGIRVIDFGQYIAGPLACRILADLGADVIKVEPITGDTMRPLAPTFEFGNRGKRSIALDLKSPRSQEIIRRMITNVDVVGHNMPPGQPRDSESITNL